MSNRWSKSQWQLFRDCTLSWKYVVLILAEALCFAAIPLVSAPLSGAPWKVMLISNVILFVFGLALGTAQVVGIAWSTAHYHWDPYHRLPEFNDGPTLRETTAYKGKAATK